MPKYIASLSKTNLLSAILLALTLVACGKGGGLTVLDAQNREAASLPNLRPLSLPPRYNLDGGQTSLSQPSASLNQGEQLSIGELTAQDNNSLENNSLGALLLAGEKNPDKEQSKKQSVDMTFLQKLLASEKPDANIRRDIAESNKQPVPISDPLLKAILENNAKK